MWQTIKAGWSIAWRQPFAVFALFLYNLAWGVVLYKLIQSIVLPLLHRYPGHELSPEALQLFWIEGQFRLMKTNLVEPYLWWALALIVLRMLIHPLLNAGVYYSLHHRELNAGYRFVEGIRKLTPSYLGLYILQLALSLAPLVPLVPHLEETFGKHSSYAGLGYAILPAVGLYLAYLFLIQLLFMHLQIGKVSGRSLPFTLFFTLRQLPVILLTALIVLAITTTLTALVYAASFLWAGFIALIGLQAYRLAQTFFKLWAICTQYALWEKKA